MDRTRMIFIGIIGLAVIAVASIAGFMLFRSANTQPILGLVGSEKIPFFEDEEVLEHLRNEYGLDVTVERAGSRQIATDFNLDVGSEYDFVFPAGVPAAEKIRQENNNISRTTDPFFTPMAIATWQPIADLLVQEQIAVDQGGYYTLDMAKFVALMEDAKRWNDLPNNDKFPTDRGIYITSTDIRRSNSAAMYLSLVSYIINNNEIVPSVDALTQEQQQFLADIFIRQGLRPSSSAGPFEDYLTKGIGHSPIVMIYESQFIAQAALQNGSITNDMVLMYPQPTIFTKHTLLPITEAGQTLGEALANDPFLQQKQIEYGFRNNNLQYFREFTNQNNIALPETLIDVIDPPSYEVIEEIILYIEQQYTEVETNQAGGN